MNSNRFQSGAVSLFLVVFSMLIITVMTISFLRLMLADQQQASDTDLSQSAYDSAVAGVEDAKRALIRYQEICSASPNASACSSLNDALSTDVCNAAVLIGGVVNTNNMNGGTATDPGEILIQQSAGSNDASLRQAYTCLTMKLKTKDYVGDLSAGDSQIIPLISESPTFNTVTIRWFSTKDLTNTTGNVSLTGVSATSPLLANTSWPADRPPVMRAQLIQFGDTFTLNSFDQMAGTQSNASTVFLYPTSATATSNEAFTDRDKRSTGGTDEPDADPINTTPLPTHCSSNVSSGQYACSMSLRLPDPAGGGNRKVAYLRLTPYYNASHYQILLSAGPLASNESNLVRFEDVQPEIDSTGRANDFFRRIISRVDLYDTTFPYPDASIDVTGNFCKDFGVSDTLYQAGSCTP